MFAAVGHAGASTLRFTAQATLSTGLPGGTYPGLIEGVLEFGASTSSSVPSGDGVAHYGAGTMTLTYNAPWTFDLGPFNLYAQQDYASSGQVHDWISIGTALPPVNAHPFASGFTLNLFGDTDLLGGEGFADVVSVLTNPAALASLVQSGIFAPTGYLSTTWGTVTYGQVALETDALAPPVPVPAAVWLFGSGLLGLVGVARRHSAR